MKITLYVDKLYDDRQLFYVYEFPELPLCSCDVMLWHNFMMRTVYSTISALMPGCLYAFYAYNLLYIYGISTRVFHWKHEAQNHILSGRDANVRSLALLGMRRN